MSKKLIYIILLFITCIASVKAQNTENTIDESMNNFLRQSDKLYAVIAVLLIIFTCIILFLLNQDKKINQIKKEFLNNNKLPKN
jgi:hypothetical protein